MCNLFTGPPCSLWKDVRARGRASCVLGLSLFLLLGVVDNAQEGSLSISIPKPGRVVGNVLSEKSGDLYWFAATSEKQTVLRKLQPGVYTVQLLCGSQQWKEERLTVQIEPGARARAAFTETMPTSGASALDIKKNFAINSWSDIY